MIGVGVGATSLVVLFSGASSAPLLAVDNGTITATGGQNPPPTLAVSNGTVTATARQ